MTACPPHAAPSALCIPARFNGPPASANGGWTGGSLARHFGGRPVSVALRAPVPLDQALTLAWQADGRLLLSHQGEVLADAAAADLVQVPPEAPDIDSAEAAGALGRLRSRQRGAASVYARCFACGQARDDGLALAPGPVGDQGLVAGTWVPPAALAGADGRVLTEATWAALDCPAGFAWSQRLGGDPAMVTVHMTVAIAQPLQPGQRYRVIAWPIAQDGRKLHAGSAIVDDAGELRAQSRQLWLLPRPAGDGPRAAP